MTLPGNAVQATVDSGGMLVDLRRTGAGPAATAGRAGRAPPAPPPFRPRPVNEDDYERRGVLREESW
ncbi:hypothetical protein BBK82_42985 [Lentzea guizhouensis]|uniref:Uncharacterized protein n=1 Tax=Lentzea guizhouensis TaxID=1586287 RepID=A0A1B2HVF4_9PSEU|nr:hypothetical protein [Lentzea guizhouensis]ANZ41714.1 hypothetical protein BBK82_42985 [Lentzea guizhouensis]